MKNISNITIFRNEKKYMLRCLMKEYYLKWVDDDIYHLIKKNNNYNWYDGPTLLQIKFDKDNNYKELYAKIHGLNIPEHNVREIIKEVKRIKNELKVKGWKNILPLNIVDWANNEFRKIIETEDLEYVDNYRVADIKKSSQVRRYKKQKENGCCGYFDTKLTGPDGRVYLLGCNYGH
jgi:hypothetical protein